MTTRMAVTMCIAAATAWADSAPPLVLESKITLDHVRGRIDHLTADIARQRIYVAELGNNTVGVVDLQNHTVIRTLSGRSPFRHSCRAVARDFSVTR
jgi:YVTN family beta-propeller protein